jgi:hypothetical protein
MNEKEMGNLKPEKSLQGGGSRELGPERRDFTLPGYCGVL